MVRSKLADKKYLLSILKSTNNYLFPVIKNPEISFHDEWFDSAGDGSLFIAYPSLSYVSFQENYIWFLKLPTCTNKIRTFTSADIFLSQKFNILTKLLLQNVQVREKLLTLKYRNWFSNFRVIMYSLYSW